MTNEYGEENKEKEEGKCAGGITRPFPMMFMLIPLLPLPPVLSMVIPFTSYSLIHDPIVLSILRLCRLCRKRRWMVQYTFTWVQTCSRMNRVLSFQQNVFQLRKSPYFFCSRMILTSKENMTSYIPNSIQQNEERGKVNKSRNRIRGVSFFYNERWCEQLKYICVKWVGNDWPGYPCTSMLRLSLIAQLSIQHHQWH